METPVYNSVTKVVKFIDPIEVPAYRMKMMYLQRKPALPVLKATVHPYNKLYIKSFHPY
jgi:hypothetical protein